MILDLVYTNRNHYTSNQVGYKPTYLLGLGTIGLNTKNFYYLVNTLTDKADIYIREKKP